MFQRDKARIWISGGLLAVAAVQWGLHLSAVAWFAATFVSALGTWAHWNAGPGGERWGETSVWKMVVATASGVALLIALGQWIVVGTSGPEACIPGMLQLILLAWPVKNRV